MPADVEDHQAHLPSLMPFLLPRLLVISLDPTRLEVERPKDSTDLFVFGIISHVLSPHIP